MRVMKYNHPCLTVKTLGLVSGFGPIPLYSDNRKCRIVKKINNPTRSIIELCNRPKSIEECGKAVTVIKRRLQ
jgi:hypothetical protein